MNMEEAGKDQSASSVNAGRSKLRYPLRSATKVKEEKQPSGPDLPHTSASKRGRPAASVSKSMGVLDVSAKNSASKPPRRLSGTPSSTTGSASKLVGNITPISEARARRSVTYTGAKSDTPASDASKSSSRRKFKLLSSPSYWLSQIKLSEADAKHSISLGFFKLALEAGCEDIQRMRDELKVYARQHNLVELGGTVKDLFDIYNISESLEQLQVSETYSQVPDEATRSSDDDVHRLKPKSLNTDAKASPVTVSRKENTQKNTPANRTRGASVRNSVNSKVVSDTGGHAGKKPQKPSKQVSCKGKEGNTKNQENNVADNEGPTDLSPTAESLQENKENVDAPPIEEIGLTA